MEDFSKLTPAQKVEAVLATQRRPYPRDIVLERAGIDTTTLDQETAREVEAILERWIIPDSANTAECLYGVPPDRQQEVIARLGVEQKTVHAAISRIGLNRYGRNKESQE